MTKKDKARAKNTNATAGLKAKDLAPKTESAIKGGALSSMEAAGKSSKEQKFK